MGELVKFLDLEVVEKTWGNRAREFGGWNACANGKAQAGKGHKARRKAP
jgi:hypothetical protein